MSKHTAGPWNYRPPTAQNPSSVAVSALSGFVRIYDAPLTAETEANAHLIAAAPDLLAACEKASAWLAAGMPAETGNVHADLDAAIARATADVVDGGGR